MACMLFSIFTTRLQRLVGMKSKAAAAAAAAKEKRNSHPLQIVSTCLLTDLPTYLPIYQINEALFFLSIQSASTVVLLLSIMFVGGPTFSTAAKVSMHACMPCPCRALLYIYL